VDWCICGTTKILFCIYCKQVLGYQKEDEGIRISISILAGLLTDKKQDEYDPDLQEQLK
jgi:hypothetical protein